MVAPAAAAAAYGVQDSGNRVVVKQKKETVQYVRLLVCPAQRGEEHPRLIVLKFFVGQLASKR